MPATDKTTIGQNVLTLENIIREKTRQPVLVYTQETAAQYYGKKGENYIAPPIKYYGRYTVEIGILIDEKLIVNGQGIQIPVKKYVIKGEGIKAMMNPFDCVRKDGMKPWTIVEGNIAIPYADLEQITGELHAYSQPMIDTSRSSLEFKTTGLRVIAGTLDCYDIQKRHGCYIGSEKEINDALQILRES